MKGMMMRRLRPFRGSTRWRGGDGGAGLIIRWGKGDWETYLANDGMVGGRNCGVVEAFRVNDFYSAVTAKSRFVIGPVSEFSAHRPDSIH